MKEKTLDLKTVYECNRCLGSKTFHPQVTLINLEKPGLDVNAVKFEFYAILLIENNSCGCCCGWKYYDFSDATMVFLTPGEIFRMSTANTLPDKGLLLAFHPDLLQRTSLKNHIDNYTFFAYNKDEALHLSQRETATAVCCLENIEEELHHPIDVHTNIILSRHIELLLDYCARFYERQFITRENRNKLLIKKLDKLFGEYIASGRLQDGEIPAAKYCAKELRLSTAYFYDLLKIETGKTFDEYLQLKRLDAAKQMLHTPDNTPAFVAHWLGFSDIYDFNQIFEKITGSTPGQYRYSQN